jgi:glycosyltransferase involved in cell wall biosynthesis
LNFVVPNFIDMRKFPPGDRAAARREWNLPPDSLIFLCVAAIKKTHKRIDYLVREFHQFLQASGADARLVVAGAREPETDEVLALGRDLLGDRVTFLENVPRSRMLSLYQASDVFVLTSLHEMFGNVFLEAMSTGLPVIANDTPTLRYVMGQAGLLADLSQPGVLAAQLSRMMDPGLRRTLGERGIGHVESSFAHTVVIPQMVSIYRQILADRR